MPPGVRYGPDGEDPGRPGDGGMDGPDDPAGGRAGDKKPPEFDWLDVVAFSIACFQLLLPGLLMMAGAVGLVYLLLWWLAGRA